MAPAKSLSQNEEVVPSTGKRQLTLIAISRTQFDSGIGAFNRSCPTRRTSTCTEPAR